jgi:peroxiredoxin
VGLIRAAKVRHVVDLPGNKAEAANVDRQSARLTERGDHLMDATTTDPAIPGASGDEGSAPEARQSPAVLPPGMPAPGFRLLATPDQRMSLAELRGRPVILAFYPADWSPECGDQMALYNQVLPEFERFGAQLLGLSVDGVWCHRAFAEDRRLQFPLLADFEPKGEVARRYGAYRAEDGTADRALFVIDADGVIRWSYVSPLDLNPGADGILDALEAIAAGNDLERLPAQEPAA